MKDLIQCDAKKKELENFFIINSPQRIFVRKKVKGENIIRSMKWINKIPCE